MALTGFAFCALFLAAIGMYGVIAYSVTQRTREIGTRLALGAQARDVIAMVLKQGLSVTITGVAAGLLGAVACSRVLTGLLFGVSPLHVPTFAAVIAVLLFVAVLSMYLPSRRAAKVDPVLALRQE